ncbi:uncharacterized protein LOC120356463, partial [Nilaparvata lugens]|uniref:uncharacterized protein LOC120356463 n=1 Tax=Nilaparvata lugens TaxID=108931 RepID=UPI00193E0D3D
VDSRPSSLALARRLRLPVWYRTHCTAWKFLTVVLQLDLIYNLHQMWNHFVLRLLTIKELNSTFFGTMGYIGMFDAADLFTYVENHVVRMDERHRKDDTNCSPAKQHILARRDTQLKRYAFAVSFLFASLFFLCAVVPYAQTCQKIVEAYIHDVTLGKDVSMIVYTYYPESFQTIALYTVFHNLLFFWYSSIVYLWAMDLRAVLMAFECLNTECALLVATVEEELSTQTRGQPKESETELKLKMRLIVGDHQDICRNTRMLDKYLRNILMGFMNVYGIQLCLILIFIMEIEETGPRLRYLFRYCMVLLSCISSPAKTESGQM